MFKYRVKFETSVQVDGWTDYRDREYKKVQEIVTVEAKNLTHAKRVAVKQAYGYLGGFNRCSHVHWYDCDIKRVTRIKKRKAK